MPEDAAPSFFCFSFFKVDPKWRWMADLAKEESAKEAEGVLAGCGVRHRTYSTLGLRDDADFMLWTAAASVEELQGVASRLYRTVFGKYVYPSHTYLSATRPSAYSAGAGPPEFLSGGGGRRYAVVYPFTKTREWYLLPAAQRQAMMDEHIAAGRRHPEVVLNTTYSFGLHDEDFMLAFETDDLRAFQDLIMELRGTRVSAYVASDTPMIACVRAGMADIVGSLG